MEKRICTKCHIEKPITEFYKDKSKSYGHRPDCKVCNTKRSVAYGKLHREQNNFNNLKHCTGIDKTTYLELLELQNGVCAICGKKNVSENRNLSVDHCHDTHIVRGLLCTKCNFGLGYFDDKEENLLNAINYLHNNLSKLNLIFKTKRKNVFKDSSHF